MVVQKNVTFRLKNKKVSWLTLVKHALLVWWKRSKRKIIIANEMAIAVLSKQCCI